jgi:ribosomal-protein-alanine N-acetyltransferase
MDPLPNLSPRPACLEDLDSVLKIEESSHPRPWSRTGFEKELSTPWSRFLVLTDDETDTRIFAYIVYWIQVEGVSLLNVTVAPEWRGMGLSRKLMQLMIQETIREEIPRILLEVRESNQTAIRLYESCGFKKTHERKGFYADGESAWVMENRTEGIETPIQ